MESSDQVLIPMLCFHTFIHILVAVTIIIFIRWSPMWQPRRWRYEFINTYNSYTHIIHFNIISGHKTLNSKCFPLLEWEIVEKYDIFNYLICTISFSSACIPIKMGKILHI